MRLALLVTTYMTGIFGQDATAMRLSRVNATTKVRPMLAMAALEAAAVHAPVT